MTRKPLIWALCALFILSACGEEEPQEDSPVVARYKDQTLSKKQLDYFIPNGIPPEDSARFAKHYMQQWLRNQAICDVALQANEGLAEEVEFKVDDYRMKLIVHEYHSRLITDSLQPEISLAEMRTHYEQFKSDFISQDFHYKYYYVAVANQDGDFPRDILGQDGDSRVPELLDWALKNALDYKLDSSYVGGEDIEAVAVGFMGSLKTARIGKLIRWSGVKQGEKRQYFFKMLDVVSPGDTLPLELCTSRIRKTLLNERKVRLIEANEEKILNDAKANNLIK